MKNEKYKKSLTTTAKLFSFIFCISKRIYFAPKHGLGKCVVYTITFLVIFFSFAEYLK